jgi:hypothetical protein
MPSARAHCRLPLLPGAGRSGDEITTHLAHAEGRHGARKATMTAESDANPGDWLPSDDPEPYSQHADEHPDGTLPSADPSWPAQVRDAWESFRQARAQVSALIDPCNQLDEEQTSGHSLAVVAAPAYRAMYAGDAAYNKYVEEWYSWQPRPERLLTTRVPR